MPPYQIHGYCHVRASRIPPKKLTAALTVSSTSIQQNDWFTQGAHELLSSSRSQLGIPPEAQLTELFPGSKICSATSLFSHAVLSRSILMLIFRFSLMPCAHRPQQCGADLWFSTNYALSAAYSGSRAPACNRGMLTVCAGQSPQALCQATPPADLPPTGSAPSGSFSYYLAVCDERWWCARPNRAVCTGGGRATGSTAV